MATKPRSTKPTKPTKSVKPLTTKEMAKIRKNVKTALHDKKYDPTPDRVKTVAKPKKAPSKAKKPTPDRALSATKPSKHDAIRQAVLKDLGFADEAALDTFLTEKANREITVTTVPTDLVLPVARGSTRFDIEAVLRDGIGRMFGASPNRTVSKRMVRALIRIAASMEVGLNYSRSSFVGIVGRKYDEAFHGGNRGERTGAGAIVDRDKTDPLADSEWTA